MEPAAPSSTSFPAVMLNTGVAGSGSSSSVVVSVWTLTLPTA